jgi:hypothetical protein
MKAIIKETFQEAMEVCRAVTPTCLEEEKESSPEEIEAVAKPQEVPEEVTDEEAIGAAEDRSKDLRLAVRCRARLKTRTKCDGRLRHECAATIGRPTRRSIPAMRKGGLRKGPGKKRHSGIKGPSRTLVCRMGGRSLRKRRTKFNVAQGNLKDRTCKKRQRSQPECNSGILKLNQTFHTGKRGMIVKGDQRPEAKRAHREVTRRSLRLEITRLIVGSYIGLREPSIWKLSKCLPRRSGRGSAIAAPREAAAINNGGGRH